MTVVDDFTVGDRFVPHLADHRFCGARQLIPRFFALEGIDGSGKTTVCREIVSILGQRNIPVYLHKEPAGSELGLLALDSLYYGDTSSFAQAMTFTGLMAYHFETIIRPHLDMGDIVVSDRNYPSTLVYHEYSEYYKQIRSVVSSLCDIWGGLPNVFVLDVDPRVAATRAGDSVDDANIDRLTRLRHGYRRLALRWGWQILSGERATPEENAKLIVRKILGE